MKKTCFALLIVLFFTYGCVTYQEPLPTMHPATLTAVVIALTGQPVITPMINTDSVDIPSATPEPTTNSCAGLSVQECAHAGTHQYYVAQELAFSDCLPVYTVGDLIPHTYVFSSAGMTIAEIPGYELIKITENVYELPDTEYGYSWRFTFTADSVIEDVPFTGEPCTQTTWTLLKP